MSQTNQNNAGQLAHMVTLNTNVNLTRKLSANITAIYGGKRYAYLRDFGTDPVSEELPAYMLANLFLNYRNVVPGLTIGIGAYDLLNEKPVVPEAYSSDYAPIPGRSREYVVKLSYQLNFKKNEK